MHNDRGLSDAPSCTYGASGHPAKRLSFGRRACGASYCASDIRICNPPFVVVIGGVVDIFGVVLV